MKWLHVHFREQSGHHANFGKCPLLTRSRHLQLSVNCAVDLNEVKHVDREGIHDNAVSFRVGYSSIAWILRRASAKLAKRSGEYAFLRYQRGLRQGRGPRRARWRGRALPVTRRRGRCGRAYVARLSEHTRNHRSRECWRKRLGDKLELLLAESLRVAHEAGALRSRDIKRVTADTTVQPKNQSYLRVAKHAR